jgi:hypothetical protein
MFTNFNIAEFCKLSGNTPEGIPLSVADKIIRYHMTPLQIVRSELGVPIHVTSGFRPIEWEVKRGRSGNSQHTFQVKGAVDVSLFRNTHRWQDFADLIKQHYMRIAWYPIQNFMHLDHDATQRQFFIVRNSTWMNVSLHELRKAL